MIVGNGPLANGAREAFGDVPFCWILSEPPLPDQVYDILAGLRHGMLVVLSTPAKVGTCADLELRFPNLRFAVVPENVRRDHPEDWKTQARFVVGLRGTTVPMELAETFAPAIYMSPESAEMVKHALNGFLGVSVVYAQEIAEIANGYGADPFDVARGVMSDPRIGQGAYLKPVGDKGSHIQRELDNLYELQIDAPILAGATGLIYEAKMR